MGILLLYRVCLSDLCLRHDDSGLFTCALNGVEVRKIAVNWHLSTFEHADAAGGCGRVQVLTNFGQALFRAWKSENHAWPTRPASLFKLIHGHVLL